MEGMRALDSNHTVTPDIHDALFAADLAERGTWPLPGGWLDQVQTAVDAIVAVWTARAVQRAESAKRG